MAVKNMQGRLREAVELHSKGRWEEAEGIYRELLEAKFRRADVKHLLGVVRVQRGAVVEGVGYIREALKAKPRAAPVHNHLANALVHLNRYKEAIKHYRMAIALDPKTADAYSNLGNALLEVGEPEESVKACRKAVALAPRLPEAHLNLSLALQELGRLGESATACDKALRLNHRYPKAISQRAFLGMRQCEWEVVKRLQIEQGLAKGKSVVMPLAFLALSDDPAAQRKAAENYLVEQGVDRIDPMAAVARPDHDRLRVGYLSTDFHDHAVMHLCAGMFECHDRSAFEVHALSIGPDKQDAMRERALAAFEHFHELGSLSDDEITDRIRELGIDVLVDLAGLTRGHRIGVMARRPAPVQVSYMGYPATTGTTFHDYLVADEMVVPAAAEGDYSEEVIRLPHCYLATDCKREIGSTPDRAQLGLPEAGFVFCSFNGAQKITREVFEIWMRLLVEVPEAVVWLFADNEGAQRNLRAAAEKREIDPDRLVFAPRVSSAEHLGRLRQADLLIDTFPYTAHTTMVDALWVGVPGVTCMGRSFASRVAGSLLQGVGLGELVTEDHRSFEKLALELAKDRPRLEAIRNQLKEKGPGSPVFDTARFTREMEEAYREMWRRKG